MKGAPVALRQFFDGAVSAYGLYVRLISARSDTRVYGICGDSVRRGALYAFKTHSQNDPRFRALLNHKCRLRPDVPLASHQSARFIIADKVDREALGADIPRVPVLLSLHLYRTDGKRSIG